MKKLLLLLIPVFAFGQGTDLPGPIGALPDASGNPTRICSWNPSVGKCAGIVADSTMTANWFITAADTAWEFDHDVIAPNIFPSGVSPAGSLGSTSHEWLAAHIQDIYNYGPNPMSIYSDTQLIAIDTHANQPIYFYTSNALRAQIDGSGGFSVAGLGGSGNRCPHVNNSGTFSITGADCLVLPLLDSSVILENASDNTKQLKFNLGLESTGTTVTAAIPSGVSGFTMAGIDINQTYSGLPTFNAGLKTANVWNYTSTPLGYYSDISLIAIDTGANQPIQFYTQNALRGQFTGAGVFQVANLAVATSRCLHADSSGNVTVASADCSSGGAITNTSAQTSCATLLILSATYASTGCSLTVPTTGTWMYTAAVDLLLAYTSGGTNANHGLFINGTQSGSNDIGFLSFTGASGEQMASIVSHTWIVSVNAGDTIDIRAQGNSSSAESYIGTIKGVLLQ